MSSSSQYDTISTTYSALYPASDSPPTYPAAILEQSNLQHIITPFLTGTPKTVLDLACGTGYYSRLFLSWGAQSVVGVDISEGMIEEARRIQKEQQQQQQQQQQPLNDQQASNERGKLTYVLGDATSPTLSNDLAQYGAPFDIVTGTWLLNYASSPAEMERMWRTISANLKPGGVFVGLTISPALGGRHELDRAFTAEWPKIGMSGHVLRELNGGRVGFEAHVSLGMPDQAPSEWVEFDCFWLRSEVFESTAKKGGMEGGFEWQPFVLTDEVRRSKERGHWNDAVLNPHFRICVAWK